MTRFGKSPRDIRFRRRKNDEDKGDGTDELSEFEELSGEVARESDTQSEKSRENQTRRDDIEELAGEPLRDNEDSRSSKD